MANELAIICNWGPELTEANMTSAEMSEEMVGLNMELPRVKIPSGGILQFELPNYEDPTKPRYSEVLRGVLIYHNPANAYWVDSNATNTPPTCSSPMADIGIGSPGGHCKACPLNVYGSGEGGVGKACKNMHKLYIQTEDTFIPVVLTLPATSIRPFSQFLQLMFLSRRIRPSSALLEIGLKKETNSSGQQYSMATFRVVGWLEEALAGRMLQHRDNIKRIAEADRNFVVVEPVTETPGY